MSSYIDPNGVARPERREHADLREIFDDVVRLVEPFFRQGVGLNGSPTEYWAARAIREAYPALTQHDVQVLLSAALRYGRERGGGVADNVSPALAARA